MSAEAIRNTLARYCHTCDDGRFDEFGELFEPDGVFAVQGMDPVAGQDAIRAFMEAAQPPERRGKHLCGIPLVAVDDNGDTASASTDFVFVGRAEDGGGWSVVAVGRYEDRLVRSSDGAWRFARRTITML